MYPGEGTVVIQNGCFSLWYLPMQFIMCDQDMEALVSIGAISDFVPAGERFAHT